MPLSVFLYISFLRFFELKLIFMPIFDSEIGSGLRSASVLDWFTGLGGLAGNVLGLLGGINSNKKANATNLRIAEMNNRAQMDMFNRGLLFNKSEREATQEFNRAMWFEQQKYLNQFNDPSAVASRLRGAGLNPTLVMSGDSQAASLGSVSSSPASAPSAPSLTSPSVIPEFSASDFQDALASSIGLVNVMADIDSKHIDNETRRSKNIADLQRQLSDINESIERIASSKQGRKESKKRISLLEGQAKDLNTRIEMLEFQRDHQDEVYNMTKEQMQAGIDLTNEQVRESKVNQISTQLSMYLGLQANSRAERELKAKVADIASQIQLRKKQGEKIDVEVYEKELSNYIMSLSVPQKEHEAGRSRDKRKLFEGDSLPSQISRLIGAGISEVMDITLGRINF